MSIFISTGLNKKLLTSRLVKRLEFNGITKIELSSGLFEKNVLKKIKIKKKTDIILHNYFPVPKSPFILNLASLNKKIYLRSLNHIKKAINFTAKINFKYFSFHAGFLIDPNVKDFGKSLPRQIVNDRKKVLKIYIKRLKILSKFAKQKGVTLLLENNVITKKNLGRFDKNPFLMTRWQESKEILMNTDDNVRLLVDVAHLKVSAKTLNYDPKVYLKKLNKWIMSYHLSDNDGLSDSNENLKQSSWFWDYIKKDAAYYTLELKNLSLKNIKSQLLLTKKKLNIKNI